MLGTQTLGSNWSHQRRSSQDCSFGIFWPEGRPLIQVDGSMKSLGTVLLQKGRPVIYVFRILTSADTNYSNIKRELLSIFLRLERLHHYVFGSRIEVQINHKPLILIWKKSIAAANPWLQCLLLWLVRYDVELMYLKAKTMSLLMPSGKSVH